MDWKRKFSSRKFWMAIALFVSGLILAFGGDQKTADTVMGVIMQGAAVIAYIVAEGLVDQENAQYYTPKHEEEKK
jgi:uncharacterized membrane protein